MTLFTTTVLAVLSVLCTSANAALVRVNDFGNNPTNLQMNIYVPSNLATNPAIILAVRLCSQILYIFSCSFSAGHLNHQA
jgi:acetylxylan esterase